MATGDETLKERGPTLLEQIVQACLDKLATKKATPLVRGLRDEAVACQRELDAWRSARPTEEARTAMRTRLLDLNARIDGA